MIQTASTLSLLLLMLAALGGCTSAEQRLEQGQALEDAGQYARAAHRYVQALRKDPGLAEARERLLVAGHDALAAYLAQAEQDRLRGDAVARADSYQAAEDVLLAARSVQVTLTVPRGFASSKRAARTAAIQAINADSASLAARSLWSDALQRLDEAARFEPSPAQSHELTRTRLDTLVNWGEAQMAAGHFRAAMEIAHQGMQASAPGDHWHRAFQTMHGEAVHAATVTVAFMPVSGGDGSAQSRALLAAINDDLQLEHWLESPPLIRALDPRPVRRAVAGKRPRKLNAARALRIGRRLGADFVVLSTLQDYNVEETGVRERTRKATTRRGAPARYTERSGTLRMQATADFRVLPVSGPARAPASRVSASHSMRFTDAHYPAGHRRLKLTPAQARAFAHRDDDAARERLAGTLAAKLAQAMFDEILEHIP